jgi:hypothetical protein
MADRWMSAVEQAIQKIKSLAEAKGRILLEWLGHWDRPRRSVVTGQGTAAVRGFARRLQPQPLTTDEWMKTLREGEQ